MAIIEKRVFSSKTTYRAKVRLKGFPPATASFDRLTDAKKWATETETKIREGRYFKSIASREYTLNDAIDRYLKTVLPQRPKLVYARTLHLKFWKKELGDYALAHITPALIVGIRDELAIGITERETIRAPATVNRYISALAHVFSVAVKEWCWLEDTPFNKLRKLKEPRGRIRFLSDDERKALLKACKLSKNKYLYPIVLICLATGARKMEINALRWKHVDLTRKRITLMDTKNGDVRVLPFSDKIKDVLQELHEQQKPKLENLVFPSEIKANTPIELRKHWYLAIDDANIKDFRFHDLRHSAASYLAMNGASLADISEILGHKTLSMVKRYAHISETHTAKVVEAMNNKIFSDLDIA
jgi:integrase